MNSLGEQIRDAFRAHPLYALLCLGFVLLPISNSAGQVPIYLASVGWVVMAIRNREPVRRQDWLWLAGFAIIILASLAYSVRPENGVDKLNRLLLFPLALAVPGLAAKRDGGVQALVLSFCAGVSLSGLYDCFRFPCEVIMNGRDLFDVGSMTTPQFYMTGLILFLGFGIGNTSRLPCWLQAVMILLMVSGLLLHNKRGVWLACMLAIGLWVVINRRWRILLAMIIVGSMAISVPKVRERLSQLQEVIVPTHGGRSTLWTQVAPKLLPEYPFGMGYNASEFEDFDAVTDYHVEEGLRHLHNNMLQIRLELGWHGVTWWTLWMAAVLLPALLLIVRLRNQDPLSSLHLSSAVVALTGLLLNGVVEYNFGDSEILMLYLTMIGLVSATAGSSESAQAE